MHAIKAALRHLILLHTKPVNGIEQDKLASMPAAMKLALSLGTASTNQAGQAVSCFESQNNGNMAKQMSSTNMQHLNSVNASNMLADNYSIVL